MRLNNKPMTVCLKLSLMVLCVCHPKPPKARLAPSKLPEPQVHLVHIASLPACCIGRICAAIWEFCLLVLTVLVGESRCSVPVQPEGRQNAGSVSLDLELLKQCSMFAAVSLWIWSWNMHTTSTIHDSNGYPPSFLPSLSCTVSPKFPHGITDSSNNTYKVNLWLWLFGRGNQGKLELSVADTENELLKDCHRSTVEKSKRSKAQSDMALKKAA